MQFVERIKAWLWLPRRDRLPEGVERLLAAYYWDGAVPVPREVREVSAGGAYIVTPEKWYPGTIMDLSLEFDTARAGARPAPCLILRIRSKVVSHGPDGVSVAFVCVNRQERRELAKFLKNIRSRGGQ